jgi:TetR/AcrR family transcriptional regulator, mexCD-oprJ operon repressor
MPSERAQVLAAAAEVLSRRHNATMEQIARAAGISRATLHRLFPGRGALVRELVGFTMAQIEAAIEAARIADGTPDAALRRLFDTLVPLAGLYAFLSGENHLLDEPAAWAMWTDADKQITELFLRGQETGVFRVDLSATWLTDALFALLAGVGWAVFDGRLGRRDASRALGIMINGALR